MVKSIVCFWGLFFGLSLGAMNNLSNPDPNYQQPANISSNDNIIKNIASDIANTVMPSNPHNSFAVSPIGGNQKENIFNLESITFKNEKNELSNKELLEQAGFNFSGLEKQRAKKSLVGGDGGFKIPPEMIPVILQLVNNNIDANSQKTQETMKNVLEELSKSKIPVVQQSSSWLKGVWSTLGLGGTSAGGSFLSGLATLVLLVIFKKAGWF